MLQLFLRTRFGRLSPAVSPANVRFREEPAEEEDEEEEENKDEGDTEERNDDDDENGGYLICN
jgi:ribosomal protein L12E/L44/L45/RPP1/RPP2